MACAKHDGPTGRPAAGKAVRSRLGRRGPGVSLSGSLSLAYTASHQNNDTAARQTGIVLPSNVLPSNYTCKLTHGRGLRRNQYEYTTCPVRYTHGQQVTSVLPTSSIVHNMKVNLLAGKSIRRLGDSTITYLVYCGHGHLSKPAHGMQPRTHACSKRMDAPYEHGRQVAQGARLLGPPSAAPAHSMVKVRT